MNSHGGSSVRACGRTPELCSAPSDLTVTAVAQWNESFSARAAMFSALSSGGIEYLSPGFTNRFLVLVLTAAIGWIVIQAWHWIRTTVHNFLSRQISQPVATRSLSSAERLPQEIVDMIADHIFYDKRSLQAYSLTCRSWYIAALHHLYYAIAIIPSQSDWGRPIRHMDEFNLWNLVKKLRIRITVGDGPRFLKRLLARMTIPLSWTCTNVRELGIEYLDIHDFIQSAQWYFGHLFATVQSLALRDPRGSRREIIFFIGLFPHLQDLELLECQVRPQEEPEDDRTLVPRFTPPLRGRLVVTRFTRVGVLEDMITLFGGIGFRRMDIFQTDGMRLLLDATAETLETLRLCPKDPRGEKVLSE